jgi:hypothetical protein
MPKNNEVKFPLLQNPLKVDLKTFFIIPRQYLSSQYCVILLERVGLERCLGGK